MYGENIDSDFTSPLYLGQIQETLDDLQTQAEEDHEQDVLLLKEVERLREIAEEKEKKEEEITGSDTEESAVEGEESQETFTEVEVLTDIRNELELSNELHILCVISLWVCIGLLFAKIFIDRIIRL